MEINLENFNDQLDQKINSSGATIIHEKLLAVEIF